MSRILSSLPLGQMLEAAQAREKGLLDAIVNRYVKDFIRMAYSAVTEEYFTEYQVSFCCKVPPLHSVSEFCTSTKNLSNPI